MSFSPLRLGRGRNMPPGLCESPWLCLEGCCSGGTRQAHPPDWPPRWGTGLHGGFRPTLVPLVMRLWDSSFHLQSLPFLPSNRGAGQDCSGGYDGRTWENKRNKAVKEAEAAPGGCLECHADEFGRGLRVRLARTWSELCWGKITDRCVWQMDPGRAILQVGSLPRGLLSVSRQGELGPLAAQLQWEWKRDDS